jgi:hypothetical protein
MAARTPTNPKGFGRIKTEAAKYSKLTVRMPKNIHAEIQALAEEDMRGINASILVLLDFALEHYPYTQKARSERLREAARAMKAKAS